jgi:hypothetical protein
MYARSREATSGTGDRCRFKVRTRESPADRPVSQTLQGQCKLRVFSFLDRELLGIAPNSAPECAHFYHVFITFRP